MLIIETSLVKMNNPRGKKKKLLKINTVKNCEMSYSLHYSRLAALEFFGGRQDIL